MAICLVTGGALYSPDATLPCTEDSRIEPLSPYGLAKLAVENYLRVMKNSHGLQHCSLRYANVYGPRQNSAGEAGVVALFANNLLQNKPLTIFGDGLQTRDFVYVKDVADATVRALELEGAFNVATGNETSILSLTTILQKALQCSVPVIHKPAIFEELQRSCLSARRLEEKGWRTNYTLERGLEETIQWFKEEID